MVPSIAETEMQAVALRATQNRPTLISGVFRKIAWEEFDEKNKTIREVDVSYYIEKADGKITRLNPKGKVDESLLDQYVDYDPLTKTIKPSTNAGGISRADAKPEKGDGKGDDEPEKIDSVVFLVQFADSTPVNMTASQYQSRLFGPFGWIKKFYGDMTHGDIVMGADVYGWYTYPEIGAYEGNGNCNLTAGNTQEIADFYNVDISGYERVITITNCEDYESLGGVAFLASEYIDVPWVRIAGHYDRLLIEGSSDYTGDWPGLVWNMIHELGHTFGLSHSSSLDCDEVIIDSDCIDEEYGNPFDAMGNWSGRIFSFGQQEKAGWLNDENILEVYESGAYHIDSLQTEDGIVGANIYIPGIPYPIFGLEYRRADGFDSVLDGSNVVNGLIVYSHVRANQNAPWPSILPAYNPWVLIDPNPTTSQIHDDTHNDAITLFQPFHDNIYGISIAIIGVGTEGIDFTVEYNSENSLCSSITNLDAIPVSSIWTSVIVSPSTFLNLSGQDYSYTVQFPHNYDVFMGDIQEKPLCFYGGVEKAFSMTATDSVLPGWSYNSPYSTYLMPGDSGVMWRTFNIPSNLIGPHTLDVVISDINSLDTATYTTPVNVMQYVCDSSIEDIFDGIKYGLTQFGDYISYTGSLSVNPNTIIFLSLNPDYDGFACPLHSYSLSWLGDLPNGFVNHYPSLPILNWNVGQTSQIYPFGLSVTGNTVPGSYDLNLKIKDNASLEEYVYPINIEVI